jgi:hypothetical protein
VAKENNCGSINSAQKAGRTAKLTLKPRGKGSRKLKGKQAQVVAIEDDGDAGEPVLVPKPRGKPSPKPHGKPGLKPRGKLGLKPYGKSGPKPRGKLGPKPSTKRKRTETEVETPSPQKLRKRA